MKLTRKMAQQAKKSVLDELLFLQRNWECERYRSSDKNDRELIETKRLFALAIAAVKRATQPRVI